jgi:hypothetical protein
MEENSRINLLDKNCLEPEHEDSKLIALCVDKSCTATNKFVCLECMFSQHEQHKVIKLKQIQDKINESLGNGSENEIMDLLKNKLRETEERILIEVEVLKTNILEILNNKVNKFITDIYDQFSRLYNKSQEDQDVIALMRKDFKQLTAEETSTIVTYINTSFVNLNQSIMLNESFHNANKKCPFEELDKFNTNMKTYIGDTNKLITEFLNNKFFTNYNFLFNNSNLVFEWSTKSYGNYGFLYSLSPNKLAASKSTNDGTITIVRSRDKLNMENYYLEFLIDSKKGGDMEIGIGRDNVGTSCWLRTQGAYGITNMGIYEYGKLVKKDEKIEDGNIIGFEVNMRNGRTGKIFKNSKFIHEFKIDIDEVYIMAAIRKVGNSVILREYKLI